jgi:peptidoglycan hydrolase-like protein with peptidoglycan-binding domain
MKKSKSSHKKVTTKRGQKAIDPARAREIQTALIREHYMTGQPSGTWDNATQAAMQRYQADQGWQSKTTPDARALIKLGLGPSHDHLLNPESAMTTTAAPADPKVAAKPAPAADNLPHQ